MVYGVSLLAEQVYSPDVGNHLMTHEPLWTTMRFLLYDDALTVVMLCAAWHGNAYMHSCLYGNECCWQAAGPDVLWLDM